MSNERKHHTWEKKVASLRRYPIERIPTCALCVEYQFHQHSLPLVPQAVL
jgi:hypothetical protein